MSLLADVGLSAKVKAALIADGQIGAAGINVDVGEGVVTLRGLVPDEVRRTLAERIALEQGAEGVLNALALEDRSEDSPRVRLPAEFPLLVAAVGRPLPARPSPKELVTAALTADRRVNEHLVIVRVEDQAAYLTGRQDTVDARVAAAETTLQVPEIHSVHNELEVHPSV